MAKPELGTKRVCPTTGRKFYDLNRDPVVSPYTGQAIPRSAFDLPVRGTPARSRAAAREEEPEEVVEAGGPELVSLEDVEAGENKDVAADEDIDLGEAVADDTFLEETEEGEDDVSGLIDGDIEGDEEA